MLDVSVTLPPVQNVVGPPGVMVGVAGAAFTVTETGVDDAEVQPPGDVAVVPRGRGGITG